MAGKQQEWGRRKERVMAKENMIQVLYINV
jgi:hypothetical protein